MKSGIRRSGKTAVNPKRENKITSSLQGAISREKEKSGQAVDFSQIQLNIPVRDRVTSMQIDEKINEYKKLFAEKHPLGEEDALMWEDEIFVDMLGYVDGELYLNQTDTWMRLEANAQLTGLFESLVGAPMGHPLMVKTQFASDYHDANVAGKEMACAISVKKAYRHDLSSLTANWWKDLEKGETIDAVRAEIQTQLEQELATDLVAHTREEALNALFLKDEDIVPMEHVELYLEKEWERQEKPHYVRTGASMDEQYEAKQRFCQSSAQQNEARRAIWKDLFLTRMANHMDIQVAKDEVMKILCQAGRTMGLRALVIHDELTKETETLRVLTENLRKEKALDAILSQIRVHYQMEAQAA